MSVVTDPRLSGLSEDAIVKVSTAVSLLQQRDAAGAERVLKTAPDDSTDHPEILRLLDAANYGALLDPLRETLNSSPDSTRSAH